MFRKTSPQTSLLEPVYQVPAAKAIRLTQTWAWQYREQCLPLIDEAAFAPCYCADNGRPTAPLRVVISLLVLKEVFDLTDAELRETAEFDLRWQTALGLTLEDAVPCQKTLHNFRGLLAEDNRAMTLFTQLTDQLLTALEVRTDVQRLDSTQICSNIRLLSRLSRFCVTFRLLLHRLARQAPAELARIAVSVQRRYRREDGTDSAYEDARAEEGRRRLAVCARDAWRLVEALRGVALPDPAAEAYALVERLFREQCLVLEAPATPAADDPDGAETPVPVRLRGKGEVGGGTLQTPHDPDATYGPKGIGYAVTLCETVGNGETPELITHVALATAQASDQQQTVPAVEALQDRKVQPQDLLGDASFSSTSNLLSCQALGTRVIGPVPGGAEAPTDTPRIYVCCLPDAPPSGCSLGVLAEQTEPRARTNGRSYRVTFAAAACAGCPRATDCPTVARRDGSRQYQVTEETAVKQWRRWWETTPDYQEHYRWRAGIEATNSELKRAHGLGRLRVRGRGRVQVAVCLKALGCNVKRALRHWQRQAAPRQALSGAVTGLVGRYLVGVRRSWESCRRFLAPYPSRIPCAA
ncbi:MAG: transposase [Armatimonadota bacterium]